MRGQSYDVWSYTHTQRGVTGGYYGVSRGFSYPAGKGDGGRVHRAGYYGSTDDFYAAPVSLRGFPPPETEVPYRKAVFTHDTLISYEPH